MNRTHDFSERLIGVLHRIRLPLLIIMLVFIISLVSILIYFEFSGRRSQDAVRTSENIQEKLEEWKNSEEKDPETLALLKQELQDLAQSYPREYGTARALFMLGNIAWEQKEMEEAMTTFMQLANTFPNSHLTPVSLYNAASAYQNLDKPDEAQDALLRIVSNYTESIVFPQALFSLARLAENDSDNTQALEYYQRIIDEHSASKWAQIAHTRKIQLSVKHPESVDGPE